MHLHFVYSFSDCFYFIVYVCVCVCARAFRIVSWDKILRFKNTLLLLFYGFIGIFFI